MDSYAVVGAGSIGRCLRSALLARGDVPPSSVRLLRRGESAAAGAAGPIFVATTADDVEEVVLGTPEERRADLVFMQNGVLRDVLARHGAAERATRAVLRLSAHGEKFTSGGRLPTVVFGKYSGELARTLESAGVSCKVATSFGEVDEAAYMKVVWASAVPLLSDALGNVTVGEIVANYRPELEALVAELAHAAMPHAVGVNAASDNDVKRTVDHVVAYSADVAAATPSHALARREWAWRNGYILARECTPLHAAWIQRAPNLCDLLV